MSKNMTPDLTMSLRLPFHIREQLEHLRFSRAARGERLPKVRDLLLEAVAALLAKELPSTTTRRGSADTGKQGPL
jgi:hypothetical protein